MQKIKLSQSLAHLTQ